MLLDRAFFVLCILSLNLLKYIILSIFSFIILSTLYFAVKTNNFRFFAFIFCQFGL